jgi:hypothetical protein
MMFLFMLSVFLSVCFDCPEFRTSNSAALSGSLISDQQRVLLC